MQDPSAEYLIELLEDAGGKTLDAGARQFVEAWYEGRAPKFASHWEAEGKALVTMLEGAGDLLADISAGHGEVNVYHIKRFEDQSFTGTFWCSP